MTRYFLLYLVAFTCMVTACEKVIDLDIENDAPKVVIEAQISNMGVAYARVSRTVGFDEPIGNHYINDAVVTVSDVEYPKSAEVLGLTNNGFYRGLDLRGIEGRTYEFTVEVDEVIYSARSTMPYVVLIDSLESVYDPFPEYYEMPGEYRLDMYFTDPEEVHNYYRLKGYVNDSLLNGAYEFMVFDDQFFNGETYKFGLMGTRFDVDQFVSYELMSIDKGTFDYYNQLKDISGGGSTPYNPKGNFDGDCLGYFSAFSSSLKSKLIVEEIPEEEE